MLRKILSVRNVGRFLNYNASGNVELKRYNLLFAENGRGKTTLCAVLRSLQSGEPAHVLGRTTLGSVGAPEIRVLLGGATAATFSNGAWSTTVPDIAIFDSTFVSDNVYSGDAVGLEHKRNLYRVIVGKRGVDLAHQIEGLDAANRAKSTDIRERLAAVQVLVPQGEPVEAFLALQEDSTIDAKIAEKERELLAVKEADQIKNRTALSELALPAFSAGFETLLGKTIGVIAADAERRVGEQIKAHAMHGRGETWLSEGLGYIWGDACPFCGQALDGAAALMGAYRAYFSEAYGSLSTEIATLRQEVEDGFGEREIARVEQLLDQNAAAVEFWSRYCEIASPPLDDGDGVAGQALRTLRLAALGLLDRKAATPLEDVAPDPSFTAAKAALAAIQAGAASYNQTVRAANATIAAKKARTAAADVRVVESALTHLRATKKRHEPDARAACHAYESAQAEKKTLEDRKEAIKGKLDDYTNQVMDRYEQTINQILDDFNAGFRITGTRHGYPGGVASSSYQILINDTAVDLGDEGTPLDRPSFRNTLSSGDKSTLALAFFLAQLDHDPTKAAKMVAFDDPFSSQDSFRKTCTVQKIRKCGEACAQVIVLSHDDRFLKLIWDQLAHLPAERKCLRLGRVGLRDTTVSEWDIEVATQAQFRADRQALVDYHNSAQGHPRDVVNKIRPVLETYCRNLYPSQFNPADTLGGIIGRIRDLGPAHQLAAIFDDLEILNSYATRYAHGQPDAATAPIDDNELHGLVKKTLTITGGC
jgi:wobble nucleotide-excising tRNase